ncbi:MAG: YihY/virulence factor BrkB family protein [Micrococcales bacterium]|nr:YihY/virulence factor BrkB family protein [Micrococcales bacterium]
MAREGTSSIKAETAPHQDDPRKPDSPTDLHKPSWKFTFKNAWAQFQKDQCTDLAAALTYYSMMAVFPALLALVSMLGVFGQGEATTSALLDILKDLGQADASEQLKGPIESMVNAKGAGLGMLVGLLGALWSASGYVNGFGRMMNRIYEVDEGRPIWKLRPWMLLITLLFVVMAALLLLGFVLSGDLAREIGGVIGLGDQAVTIWNIAKWPVMLAIVVLMIALLYWGTPNVKQPKFRWLSVGAGIAILAAVLGSLAFGFYASNFGSYNKTYGALAGVIVFLLWIWLVNVALLLGAEVDAEMERARQLQAGIPAEETLQLPPRDARGSEKAAEKREKIIEEGREIRMAAAADGATGEDPLGVAGKDAYAADKARAAREAEIAARREADQDHDSPVKKGRLFRRSKD